MANIFPSRRLKVPAGLSAMVLWTSPLESSRRATPTATATVTRRTGRWISRPLPAPCLHLCLSRLRWCWLDQARCSSLRGCIAETEELAAGSREVHDDSLVEVRTCCRRSDSCRGPDCGDESE